MKKKQSIQVKKGNHYWLIYFERESFIPVQSHCAEKFLADLGYQYDGLDYDHTDDRLTEKWSHNTPRA